VAEALKAGHFTQVLDGAAALLRSQPATYEITFPPARRRIRSRALLLTVSNGPLIGARLKVAPQADLRRPELVMTLYGGMGRLRTAANFLGLFLRMRRVHPGARQLRFAKATISSPEALSVHLDGRPAGTLPVEVSVVPDALLVATP
jgi:diacylglycerol kinase family enzyme